MGRTSKRARAEAAKQELTDAGILWDGANNGWHVMVRDPSDPGFIIVDFWPSSGKFIFRDTTQQGVGVHELLKLLRER